MSETDTYYLNLNEPNRSCALLIHDIILNYDPHISLSKKYGMPCFSYKKKMFCFLNIDKNSEEPYILFVEGKYLNHPLLEKGNRRRMKIFRVNPKTDIKIDTIKVILDDALNLYRKGIIKIK